MNIPSFTVLLRLSVLSVVIFISMKACSPKSDEFKIIKLEPYSRIQESARAETSGIVKSRTKEGIYWVHGDSGNEPNVYPINKFGEVVSEVNQNGVELRGMKNIDWEDIAMDDSGNLIVADIGNNCFCREDQSILIFPEPDENKTRISNYQRIWIEYPDNQGNGDTGEVQTPDAEAVFYKNGVIYILTKESRGVDTKLYKLESTDGSEIQTLVHVTTLNFGDKVTAADFSVNRDSLAVLTSSSAWIFTNFEGEDFFSGTSSRVHFRANQVESIAFTGEGTFIIAEEEGYLYEIRISDFK